MEEQHNYMNEDSALHLINRLKDLLAGELAKKAPISNPVFSGIPMAPTPSEGNNSQQIATTEFVTRLVANSIAGGTLSLQVVTELPETGEAGVLYFVPNSLGLSQDNYSEYVWVNERFEFIGTSSIDLSDYVKKSQLVPISTEQIDEMFR